METVGLRVAPAWLKHDGEVLRFGCYFQEAVYDSSVENYRIRKCLLSYFLADGTLQIVEPREENSGLAQGPVVKRQRTKYNERSFRIGEEIELYTIKFRIVQADEFTRQYYAAHIPDVPLAKQGDLPYPADPYHESVEAAAEYTGVPADELRQARVYNEMVAGGNRVNRGVQQHLANDRKVLRFFGFWDDRTLYGQRLYLVVHFFLADDTVEILETKQRNSGRDPYPIFYKRSKLALQRVSAYTPGQVKVKPGDLYNVQHLQLGQCINCLGREIFLYDCDDFTKQWYGRHRPEMPQIPVKLPANEHKTYALPIPPHNGFGSEEDSLASVFQLIPKPKGADLAKQMIYSDKILRFEATMPSGKPEDANRKFVVTFYLADDSVQVFEVKLRNSGQYEGKFAERSVKVNNTTGKNFQLCDFFVGAHIFINSYPFALTRADEFTLNYMEHNPAVFSVADTRAILRKLPLLVEYDVISPDQLRTLVAKLNTHELVTLIRAFPAESSTPDAPLIDLRRIREARK